MTALEKAARPIHIAPLETGNGLLPPPPAIDFDLLTHLGTILKTLGHPVRLKIIQYRPWESNGSPIFRPTSAFPSR